jgi:hypothetical protein
MPEPDYVRARMFREYRLICWSDRAGELTAVSGLVFLAWSAAACFHPRLVNWLWLGFILWLTACVWFQRFARRHYRKKSINQDPPTSRSMYKSTFIDHFPERWHAATKAAGVYEGKTVSECDPNYFRECNRPLSFFPALRSRLIEWRLSKRALRKVTELIALL